MSFYATMSPMMTSDNVLERSLKLRIAMGGNHEAMLEWIITRVNATPSAAIHMDLELQKDARTLIRNMERA